MNYLLTSFLVVYSLWKLILIFQRTYDVIELAAVRKSEEDKLLKGILVPSHITYLSRDEFREWCRIFLFKTGYDSVEITGHKENIIDMTCLLNNKKVYVVCSNKDFGEQEHILLFKLAGALASDKVDQAIIITTGCLQEVAQIYIRSLYPQYNIRVIDKNILEQEYGLLCKNGILVYP